MESEDRLPVYTLKAVIRETGIRPDTLRAWERRYGLPRPRRTSGGHRLYSRRDVEMIRWLLARQAEGMRIGRAIALWKALEAEGRDPLGEPVSGAREPMTLEVMRRAWVEAALRFDEEEAERIWTEAVALYPPERVCRALLEEGLAEIGARWYAGEATAQQEHFASTLALRRLNALVAAAPPPTRPERILLGCPPEETHTLPLLMLALVLRRRGWDVKDLGADVPLLQLEHGLELMRPHLVIMTAQLLYTAATLADAALRVRGRGIRFAFGGGIFHRYPEARRFIAGAYLGERWEEIPQRVEEILSDPHPGLSGSLPPEYAGALTRYRLLRPMMEARLAARAGEAVRAVAALDLGLVEPGRILEAALRLGEIALARQELRWLAGLFQNHHAPLEALRVVMRGYAEAIRELAPDDPVLLRLAATLEEEAEA